MTGARVRVWVGMAAVLGLAGSVPEAHAEPAAAILEQLDQIAREKERLRGEPEGAVGGWEVLSEDRAPMKVYRAIAEDVGRKVAGPAAAAAGNRESLRQLDARLDALAGEIAKSEAKTATGNEAREQARQRLGALEAERERLRADRKRLAEETAAVEAEVERLRAPLLDAERRVLAEEAKRIKEWLDGQ